MQEDFSQAGVKIIIFIVLLAIVGFVLTRKKGT